MRAGSASRIRLSTARGVSSSARTRASSCSSRSVSSRSPASSLFFAGPKRAAPPPRLSLLSGGFLALYASWWAWDGSGGWGPRFLVPLVPLLAAAAGTAATTPARRAAGAALVVSRRRRERPRHVPGRGGDFPLRLVHRARARLAGALRGVSRRPSGPPRVATAPSSCRATCRRRRIPRSRRFRVQPFLLANRLSDGDEDARLQPARRAPVARDEPGRRAATRGRVAADHDADAARALPHRAVLAGLTSS